jgi:hypothetical protein
MDGLLLGRAPCVDDCPLLANFARELFQGRPGVQHCAADPWWLFNRLFEHALSHCNLVAGMAFHGFLVWNRRLVRVWSGAFGHVWLLSREAKVSKVGRCVCLAVLDVSLFCFVLFCFVLFCFVLFCFFACLFVCLVWFGLFV